MHIMMPCKKIEIKQYNIESRARVLRDAEAGRKSDEIKSTRTKPSTQLGNESVTVCVHKQRVIVEEHSHSTSVQPSRMLALASTQSDLTLR
jgi:hypothetical protein